MLIKTKKKMKLPLVETIGFISLLILITAFLTAAKPIIQATDVEACVDCHEDLVKTYMSKPHAVIDSKGLAPSLKASNSCTACHGNEEIHLEEGGGSTIFAFKSTDVPNEKSKKCLVCHTRTNSRFLASPHGKASMDCTTCHIVHSEKTNPSLLKSGSTKSCYMCHEDVFSEFQLNERHRLQEGIMSCAACHNPHEPATRERLAGFKHESCLKCHTDKAGPYLNEHGASRIEGCTTCHVTHGTPNRHMLTHQSTSDLCFSCHTTAVSWHSFFDSNTTNCTVCHSTIHGSNLSKIFIK